MLHQLQCSSLSKIINFCNIQLRIVIADFSLDSERSQLFLESACFFWVVDERKGSSESVFFWLWFLLWQLQLMPVTARKTTKPTHRHWSCSRLHCSTPIKSSNKKNPNRFLASGFCCNFGLFHKSNCVFFLSMLFRHNSASLHAF